MEIADLVTAENHNRKLIHISMSVLTPKKEYMVVSSNPFGIMGASEFGFKTAWI